MFKYDTKTSVQAIHISKWTTVSLILKHLDRKRFGWITQLFQVFSYEFLIADNHYSILCLI